MEYRWLLLRSYRRACCYHTCFRFRRSSWVPSPLTDTLKLITSFSAAAVAFGFVAGTVCNFATQLKFLAGYDDALDVRSPLFVIQENPDRLLNC